MITLEEKSVKSLPYIIGLLILESYLSACSKEQLDKTKDFTPPLVNYEFYIEGEIDNKIFRYEQINYDWTNASNKYFIDEHETWLQAYIDSVPPENAYWNIRITNVDIINIQMPYELHDLEGNISWYDQRFDNIIENNPNCQGLDARCTFILSSDNNVIKLTSNENNVLEGLFFGKAIIKSIGFHSYTDSSLFYEIKNGKFKIKYRIE